MHTTKASSTIRATYCTKQLTQFTLMHTGSNLSYICLECFKCHLQNYSAPRGRKHALQIIACTILYPEKLHGHKGSPYSSKRYDCD